MILQLRLTFNDGGWIDADEYERAEGAANTLRLIADRIDSGERDGAVADNDGTPLGRFDLSTGGDPR